MKESVGCKDYLVTIVFLIITISAVLFILIYVLEVFNIVELFPGDGKFIEIKYGKEQEDKNNKNKETKDDVIIDEVLPNSTEDYVAYTTKKNDLIKLNVNKNQLIRTNFTLKGEVRGNWAFEGDFPVKIIDADGNEIYKGWIMLDEWMTGEYVRFQKGISFKIENPTQGYIILEKDNPSGLAVNDDSVKIEVRIGY